MQCSGERPACLRCTGSGRKCDGYTHSNHDTRPRQLVDNVNTLTAQTTSISSISIPFRMPGSQQDRQLVHYFCIEAVPNFRGNLSLDFEFWGQSVLQSMHEDAVVRQAIVAYSSSHADYVLGNSIVTQNTGQADKDQDTLRLYNKALSRLREYMATTPQPSLRTVLMCCILFYCFESTRADYDAALEHLQTGIRIIQEAKSGRSQSLDGATPLADDIEMLARVFSRLDIQASMFNFSRMPSLGVISADERAGNSALLSKTSVWGPLNLNTSASNPSVSEGNSWSVGDATHMLNKLGHWLISFLALNNSFKSVSIAELPAQLVAEKSEILWQFQNYSGILEELLQQNDSLSRAHHYAILSILKLSHRSTQMLLKASFPEDLRVFGACPNPAAEEVLDLAQSLLDRSFQSNFTLSKHALPLQLSIVGPIAMLALKCSDIGICERTLAQLVSLNKPEGLIDSEIMDEISQRIEKLKKHRHVCPLGREAALQQAEPRGGDYTTLLGGRGAEPTEEESGGLHNVARLMNVRYVASGTIFLLPKTSAAG